MKTINYSGMTEEDAYILPEVLQNSVLRGIALNIFLLLLYIQLRSLW